VAVLLGSLVKTTLVDYPGRVAAALFLKGCNLRCPYCYNTPLLVAGSFFDDDAVTYDQVINHLKTRRNVLTGFVLSGGEPLLTPELPQLITAARNLGYKIKLDTNGMLSEKLAELLENKDLKPDFIALDIKTAPGRYGELSADYADFHGLGEEIKKTIFLVSGLPAAAREFRTVLVPTLVGEAEIKEIATLLPQNAAWRFAPFQNKNCLDPKYNEIKPYTDKAMQALVAQAQKIIPDAQLR
jgi:pyruvate formate lyase activating enzyme